jgi:4-hydroxy-3-methylbut-2-en-1-yl diphosphate reductase
MEVLLAKKYGFCFGVKRAIKIAEEHKHAKTMGPLIHNGKEIERLKTDYDVQVIEDVQETEQGQSVILRTHGISKQKLHFLKERGTKIIDATCPFVTKPQRICETMSQKGYQIIIFGDKDHPEVEGVTSYSMSKPIVVLNVQELEKHVLRDKIALVSQTTRKIESFLEVAKFLIAHSNEVRVFNTICNATFENQDATRNLSRDVDIMIVVGGKNSSNTRQLLNISQENCHHSYLVEDKSEIQPQWFQAKKRCGITAGASTPDWIISQIVEKIREF